MPAPEWTTVAAVRVVADPAALDRLVCPPTARILRLAPDDALILGGSDGVSVDRITVDDPHAIVEPDQGCSAAWLDQADFDEIARSHLEWSVPRERPALAQGLVAGVPAKLWLESERVLVLTATAYLAELADRIGGRPHPGAQPGGATP